MLDDADHARLKTLADANERTIQAQARVLLLAALSSDSAAIGQPAPHPAVARAKRNRRAVA